MPEPPSARTPPPPLEDGSPVVGVGVGAALVWVRVPAARLSMLVLIPPWPPVDGDGEVPADDAEADTECTVGDAMPDTEWPPPEWDGPEAPGLSDEPPESGPPDDAPLGDGSSKSDSVGPEWESVGLADPVSDPAPESDPDPESDPESEPGPAPRSGPPMPLPPVSAEIPPPMFTPALLPACVDVEESDPDESDPSEWELESELDEDESEEEPEDESDEESEPLSLSDELESPLPSPSPSEEFEPSSPCPSDPPPCPSIRLSMAWCARCPAFSPRLSRTPSARVCGVCLMASQALSAPALTVAPRS